MSSIIKPIQWNDKAYSTSGQIDGHELFSIFINPDLNRQDILQNHMPAYILASNLPFIKKALPVKSIESGKLLAEKCLYTMLLKFMTEEGN